MAYQFWERRCSSINNLRFGCWDILIFVWGNHTFRSAYAATLRPYPKYLGSFGGIPARTCLHREHLPTWTQWPEAWSEVHQRVAMHKVCLKTVPPALYRWMPQFSPAEIRTWFWPSDCWVSNNWSLEKGSSRVMHRYIAQVKRRTCCQKQNLCILS